MTFPAFLIFCFITAFMPGPHNILALTAGLKHGFRGSFRVIGGICTGVLCVMLLCGAVVLLLISWSAFFLKVFKLAGCVYVVWMAWKILFTPADKKENDQQDDGFLRACLLQFANGKLYFYAVTAFSGFIFPHWCTRPALFAGALVLTLIGSASVVAWAYAGALLQRFFKSRARVVKAIIAVLLLACLYPILAGPAG